MPVGAARRKISVGLRVNTEFLEAMADPNHPRHAELKDWYDADFDPNAVNVPTIQLQLTDLAKRWSRSKPKRLQAP
jgi:Plasmid pRiA4b ORF-3-like protein